MSKTMRSTMKVILLTLIILVCIGIGYFLGNRSQPGSDSAGPQSSTSDSIATKQKDSDVKWWTCSMHPSVRLPSSDMKCPICFMELIPMEESGGAEGIPEILFSERAQFLAEVETAAAEHREVTKSVRLVGKIQPDETKLSMITAWVAGRLERLFVDYTGMEVRKDDHLVEIYSPELYSAQHELLSAINGTSESFIRSSKEKLRRLGLTQQQIEQLEQTGEPTDTLTMYSPTSGVVIAREGTEGMYVKEGSMIYTVADLSTLWLLLDAYESDVEWLYYGQSVEFDTEAYPGEKFVGTLSFISPVLDERSRTVKLRVNVPNQEGRLKPGMFARAVIHAVPGSGGRVIAPELLGKWICPMHPEVIDDVYGFCTVCEMPLETAASLGYTSASGQHDLPLAIPDTAPLITGKRALVYIEENREDGKYYVGREIELGPHADGYYIVESGLEEGDRVVTKGNFKIDSALQLQAKPSMMNPRGGQEAGSAGSSGSSKDRGPVQIPKEFSEAAKPMVEFYLQVQKALAGDSIVDATKTIPDLISSIQTLSKKHLPGESHDRWMKDVKNLQDTATEIGKTREIKKLRKAFYPLSKSMDRFVGHFGHPLKHPLRKVFCPMALEKGATWLQASDTVANPYYGASMLRCGTIQETYPSRDSASP